MYQEIKIKIYIIIHVGTVSLLVKPQADDHRVNAIYYNVRYVQYVCLIRMYHRYVQYVCPVTNPHISAQRGSLTNGV